MGLLPSKPGMYYVMIRDNRQEAAFSDRYDTAYFNGETWEICSNESVISWRYE